MVIDFEVQITKRFLLRSQQRRIFRHWKRLAIASGLVLIGVLCNLWTGALDKFSLVGITVLAFALIVYVAAWVNQMRFIRQWMERQAGEPVHYQITDEYFKSTSRMGAVQLNWDQFVRWFMDDENVCLDVGAGTTINMPRKQIPEEALRYFAEKLGKPR